MFCNKIQNLTDIFSGTEKTASAQIVKTDWQREQYKTVTMCSPLDDASREALWVWLFKEEVDDQILGYKGHKR